MRYFVIGPDGKTYGPAEIPMLQQWVREGRITATTQLEVEGTGQRVWASSIVELGLGATVAQSASPPFAQGGSPAPGVYPGYAPAGPAAYAPIGQANTSGQGVSAALPPGVAGWNWGAFLLNWVWAIGHNTWIGLLALVPYIGLVMAIILGVKGNEWAWQNRRWESVEQFQRTQRIWTNWGAGIILVCIVLGVIFGVMGALVAPSRTY